LLGKHEFGWDGWGNRSRWGRGRSGRYRGGGGGSDGGIGRFTSVHVRSIERTVVLGAVLSHVALGTTPEASSFGTVLGALLVRELFEWEYGVCCVDVHWDVLVVVGTRGVI
jgi:hypothetical protein